ncbi:MAG TPA: type I 3-dehydroquinate dehydratase, partial [Thermoanaerobaculia bacterium]
MTKIVASVYESSEREALITLPSAAGADVIEVRADAFAPRGAAIDFAAFRAATKTPLIFTRRGAGFDLVDVELDERLAPPLVEPFRARAILSLHDFEGVPDLEPLIDRMSAFGTAYVKIAATPRSFAENVALLEVLDRRGGNLALFGMGTAGLYSRILAPFFGSALAFVGVNEQRPAAPGQFSLPRGHLYWGERGRIVRPEAIFAVVGYPIGHSLSPAIHNPRFRELGVAAAYSIAEVPALGDVADGRAEARPYYPTGISITAPFKEEGFAFATAQGADIAPRAFACGAINTLVRRVDGTLAADNTDVEGITAALRSLGHTPRAAAVLGGGGSARSAIVALRGADLEVRAFLRDPSKVDFGGYKGVSVHPFDELASFDGDLVVNTISAERVAAYPRPLLRQGMAIIDLAYTRPRLDQLEEARRTGVQTVDGLAI